ncbi:hypothetical protein COT78_00760 [Candidatus Berkelbacteria bacterium CG10_big_fil_rev_8_21_14_0_10_43_13]|uniref:Nucleotidyl transferase AbiEii/AbiGii toxin family protein n=1 Tax=Candidatus Berkelbacteria bacterium CG10_big_fil_rev_8_21_14_0_10_43_13 TaxID=1974514 RepID=A0A2H0W7G2_9BACT|nr:MAG: hypothetical protein COT78_00760 [Candidatus Berkelbacteria bacterium CG10_big_fil_rev_8_21_14_0_10_43_13]
MLDRSLHENLMTRILVDIYSEPELRQKLGFKGGTAAYLFYGLPRFSTDLDFDLLDDRDNKKIFNQVKAICSKYGEIKDEQIKEKTIFFLVSYKKGEHNIKIEISRKTYIDNTYQLLEYFGLPILVMDQDCMFANKLVAVLGRKKMVNRDWFDAWFFLDKQWSIKKEIIENRTGIKVSKYFEKLLGYLEKNEKSLNILHGLGEVLDTKQKNYVKNKMIDDLIFLLKLNANQLNSSRRELI